jgi:hypothetical protein
MAGLIATGFLSAQEVDRLWALHYLLEPSIEVLDERIEEFESVDVSSPGTDETEIRLALGILYLDKYIRESRARYVFQADRYLREVQPPYGDDELVLVYKGMVNAFLAKIKTIFGVGNLKDMGRYMESIPEDYNDWLIRFLRGTTLLQVGRGLPAIGPLKEPKEQAIDMGTKDLRYVKEMYRKKPGGSFSRETYDTDGWPVPLVIYNLVKASLD